MREEEVLRVQILKMLLELEEKRIVGQNCNIVNNNKDKTYVSLRSDFFKMQEIDKMKSVFSVSDLSNYLGISRDSVYSMVREKQIPHFRVRRRILFHRETIEIWIRGG
ncbi:helix-turn-helix domain-containing protein [Paenibacillus sp. XY044]|uniref:helix-turn-helix domain-containing protein n=1 Tax=Paenibacillus sp. XY044 TaxID=2026089 RepID=UPI00269D02EA|nr:helix-turn-helix domain-containing protein [Paenibacillus sp. XY044]